MSFLGGAECSTAANPLSQIQKHVQDDSSLQRDRLGARGLGPSLGGFRNAGPAVSQDDAVNKFLHQGPALQHDLPLQNGFVHVDHSQGVHLRANSASPTWAPGFQNSHQPNESIFQPPNASPFSVDEFARFRAATQSPASSSLHSAPLSTTAAAQHRPMLGVGMINQGMSYTGFVGQSPMYQQPMFQSPASMRQAPDVKGKGKVVELDDTKWEEQFAQLDMQDQTAKPAGKDEALAAEPELDEMDRALHSETMDGDFESIWRGIQSQMRDQTDKPADDVIDTETWNADFTNFGGDWSRLGMADHISENYLFEEENLFADKKNCFEEGVRIMKEGGNLSLAALAFEAAVQQAPDHVEAWVYLGHVQAQNEKETAAIRAMEQALKVDPNNLEALMGLGVSYTNEGYDITAYRTLERWLSVKYPQIISPAQLQPPAEMGFTEKSQLHEKVTKLFIQAAQLSPDGEHMDPDVQVGLGVLFYGIEEFDKAIDCFRSALETSESGTSTQREQVHLLWNRLGATLANSGKSEDAIGAYQQALLLQPNFVRARYNLGVSCINIDCLEEAAQHFLAALNMHQEIERSGRSMVEELLNGEGSGSRVNEQLDRMSAQNRSTTLYDTLRRVFTLMGRRDLAEKTVAGVDPEIFRSEFDF